MKKLFYQIVFTSLLIGSSFLVVTAQTTGSIAGTIYDPNGAVVPNATIEIKGTGGQEFTATSNDNGIYRMPAVANGLYTVTVTAKGFKKSITTNVKVDVGIPTTVDSTLQIGDVNNEVVEVSSGGEVLQTQTATIGTNITGRQITETPIASRDGLDLVALLPGTASVGRPRASSINGLPKGAISITIDGVDVQANDSRSSDGYFTFVRPRIDAIEEVTVSSSNPGAESSGDGAVQVKFVTKRGTNDYKGSLFWQHRNTALNSAYWYNNRDSVNGLGADVDQRTKIQLNQFGGSFGGPLPFPHFGEGGPIIHSGKDKAYFFFNYEQFRQPESVPRTRTILTQDAQRGIYKWIENGTVRQMDLFALALSKGQISTPDQTVGALLTRIRAATANTGSITPITNSPNTESFNFTPAGGETRKFLAVRLDFNVHKNHSIEFVTNRQDFVPSKDFLNNMDERFPGFPFYTQGSQRLSYAGAVRSTFGSNIVNEARFTTANGESSFAKGIKPQDFDYQGGYALGIDAAGATTATARNSETIESNPTYDFTDSVTWTLGNHTINFGGQYKRIKFENTSTPRIVPTVGFGIDVASEGTLAGMFDTAFNGVTIPTTNRAAARALYATLIGHINAFTTTAYLTSDGTYKINSQQTKLAHQDTYGLFVQDSWRMRPNFTINYGLRWQPQGAYIVDSANYARLETPDQIWGVSGVGNLFKPGVLNGTAPRVIGMEIGEKTFEGDTKNFAPSIGIVWSPNFDNTLWRKIFGSNSKSVFRGGYSVAFVREGTSLIGSIVGGNPGGSISASRTIALGNLTTGTNLRDPGNPNLTPATFPASPAYPFTLNAQSANAFDPNLRTGSVHSYSFGYQRELDTNTVIEVRYVGNRGIDIWRQHDLNEFNTIENGFADEFRKAQDNLYANLAAGRGATFAYFGDGTGTSPLPIALAYFSGNALVNGVRYSAQFTNGQVVAPLASQANRYTSAQFTNATLVAALSRNAPSLTAFGSGSNFELSTARRANAIAAGLPSNFFYLSPTTASAASTGAFIIDNSEKTWYNSAVIEVRRRLSGGLRLQASYVFSKAQSDAYASNDDVFANFTNRPEGRQLAKNVQPFDIRHNFKLDATYDLPFGKGRMLFSNANGLLNGFVGGWSLLPVVRWQSGSPFSLGAVQLVGMTKKELQKEIKVRKDTIYPNTTQNVVTYLPNDIILNTQRAFNIDVTNTANNGYGVTFGAGGPQGRFLAPVGFGNCYNRRAGECGFTNLILYGPSFFKFDVTLAKKIMLGERRNVELRATFLNALNTPNFRVGGFAGDVITTTTTTGVGSSTFGQLATGSAYRDTSTTNDPGGRLIDLMLRINF